MLVVDDECPIADGLCEVFQSLERLELDVYKAYSAEEALDFLKENRADIVITDVRMPGMDGLGLLRELKASWPACRVVVLSGYGEFDYVYAATRYPGVRYLLKTEGYDEIIAAVEEAVQDIESGVERESLVRAANERMERAQELMRESYLEAIARGRLDERDISAEQFCEMGLPLRADLPVLPLVARVEFSPPGLSHAEGFRRSYEIRALADRLLAGGTTQACASEGSSRLVWLAQPATGEDWRACASFVRGSAELIQGRTREALGIALSFAMDGSPVGWLQLPDRIADLEMRLSYRIGDESGILLSSGARAPRALLSGPVRLESRARREAAPEAGGAKEPSPAAVRLLLERLEEHLDYGNEEEYFGCFDRLAARLVSEDGGSDLVAVERYYDIALILLSFINRRSLVEAVASRACLHKLTSADSHQSWSEAASYLRGLSRLVFDIEESDRKGRALDAIGRVKKHINDHVLEPDELTLLRLASLIDLNPSYLSRAFKRVADVNLSDYIAEARIRKAESLLADPALKVQDVAEALGYGTATNFARFFRKLSGMTPQEYRDRWSRQGT
jgi:Response regulator containing CheY-like receiver domain and AraC-type DNA-binding domain